MNLRFTPIVNEHVRDIETIDGELQMLARAWSVARELGVETGTADIDRLLDERAAAAAVLDVSAKNLALGV